MIFDSAVAKLDYGDNLDTCLNSKDKNEIINFARSDGKVIFRGDNVVFQFFSSPRFRKSHRSPVRFESLEQKRQFLINDLMKKYTVLDKDPNGNLTCSLLEYEKCVKYVDKCIHDNIKKNRKDSVRRSRSKIIEYAMCNPQLKYFLTLTYKENMTDYNKAFEDFRKFRNRVNMMMKRRFNKKFEFLCTFERQKRGAWHMHILCNLDYRFFTNLEVEDWTCKHNKRKKSPKRKLVENIIRKEIWDNGFIDYRELYDPRGSAFYIAKYLTKETDTLIENEGVKSRYLVSRGLNKEIVKEFSIDCEDFILYGENDEKKIAPGEVLQLYKFLSKQTENLNIKKNKYYTSVSRYDDYITPLEELQGIKRKVTEVKFYLNLEYND